MAGEKSRWRACSVDKGKFLHQQAMEAAGGNTNGKIAAFLQSQGFHPADIDRVLGSILKRGISIGQTLEPVLDFLRSLGLSRAQVAKVFVAHPQILGYNVEQNLKPTVRWLLDLGLSKAQIVKVVSGFPQILSLSLEQNLKPTVQWLLDLGLSNAQVGKAVARKPQLLGYSIEQNLKPTVQWLLELGLSKAELAKVVAGFTPILGCSIARNLQVKLCLLEAYFGRKDAAALVATWPRFASYSLQRLEERLRVLQAQGRLDKLVGAMTLDSETFRRRFGPK